MEETLIATTAKEKTPLEIKNIYAITSYGLRLDYLN
jgi:hypothetical protein